MTEDPGRGGPNEPPIPHQGRGGLDDVSSAAPPPIGRKWEDLVIGGLFLAAGVLWLLDVVDAADVRWAVLLPAALIVVGLALIVLAFSRQTGGLIGVGVILTVLVVLGSIAPDRLSVAIGDTVAQPTTLAQLEDHYAHGVGELTVDLRQLEFEEQRTIAASLGVGRLLVLVPNGVALDVDASAGIGEVSVMDRSNSGFGPRLREQIGRDPGRAVLVLELSVGIGQVEVRR